jgi:hypothetical protein
MPGRNALNRARLQDKQKTVRVVGPRLMPGLYAVLSHGVHEVSAESLTSAQLRPVDRERFHSFLRRHQEAQTRSIGCVCQEYRFAFKDAYPEFAGQDGGRAVGTLAPGALAPNRRTVDQWRLPVSAVAGAPADGRNGVNNVPDGEAQVGPVQEGRIDLDQRLPDHADPTRPTARADRKPLLSCFQPGFCPRRRDIIVSGSSSCV